MSASPAYDFSKYVMQQTMLRIKEPKRSLDFYTKVLGMTLIEHLDFPAYKFSLYFVGYLPSGTTAADLPPVGQRHEFAATVPGLIELTHNHGTEDRPGPSYHTGNSYEGTDGGFGHIGITVPSVYEACERFKGLGVGFKKSPNSGGMKGLAFVLDPDGYAIEVVHQGPEAVTQPLDCCGFSLDAAEAAGKLVPEAPELYTSSKSSLDAGSYYPLEPAPETAGFVMQQTMLRIKDPKRSLPFYRDVLGMTLVEELHFPQWSFSLYFMAYLPPGLTGPMPGASGSPERKAFLWSLPATVELTHNYGSEAKEADQVYHTGNNYDGCNGGFGHIGITVPDVYEACERFHSLGCKFKKSPNSGGMKGLAFVLDPDGYWIEVIRNGPKKPLQQVDCLGVDISGGGVYTGGGGAAAKE